MDDGLYRTRFSTDEVSLEERTLAANAALLRGVMTTPLSSPLELSMETWLLTPLSLTHVRASARRTERRLDQIERDGLDAVTFQLTLAGEATGRCAGRDVRTGPGDILLLDAGLPFDISDETSREGLTVWTPREVFARIHPEPETLHGLVLPPERNGLLSGFLRTLLPMLPDLPDAQGASVARVMLDLLALVLGRPTLGGAAPSLWGEDLGGPEAVFKRAAAWIDAHLGEAEILPDQVAAGVGVSRSRLYEAFAPSGGVARHIQKRRLRLVHIMLLNPEEKRSVAELAYAGGFRSPTHFARVFRTAFGVTPGELRTKVQAERA